MLFLQKTKLPTSTTALPGRTTAIDPPPAHAVLGTPLTGPWPDDIQVAYFGMGCFWGAERKYWQQPGVYTTAVGYSAGLTPNPTYEEVCSGLTGHNEVVLVAFDTKKVGFNELLKVFWESHNPTQGMRQGNDVGTQYRSGIYTTTPAQHAAASASRDLFQVKLNEAGYGAITTEVLEAAPFYYAEEYHQQYLHKRPNGYCGLGGTGVSCPVGIV